LTVQGSHPGRGKNVQTGPEAHLASYLMDFPRINRPESKVKHASSSSGEVKNE